MRLRSLSIGKLKAAGVNPALAQTIAEPSNVAGDLDIFLQNVAWDYHIPEGVEQVIPLWSNNEDVYCRWVREGKTEYVKLFPVD